MEKYVSLKLRLKNNQTIKRSDAFTIIQLKKPARQKPPDLQHVSQIPFVSRLRILLITLIGEHLKLKGR